MGPLAIAGLVYSGYQLLKPKKRISHVLPSPTELRVGGTDALPVVYGTQRVPGHLVYAATSYYNQYLWLVVAFCHGPVSSIDEVYFDGNVAFEASGTLRAAAASVTIATSSAGSNTTITCTNPHGLYPGDPVMLTGHSGSTPALAGTYTVLTTPSSTTFTLGVLVTTGGTGGTVKRQSPEYEKSVTFQGATVTVRYAEIGKYIGSTTQDTSTTGYQDGGLYGASLTAAVSEWASTACGKGLAYAVLRLTYNEDLYGATGAAVPFVEATIKGRTLYNPSTGTTAYSANPILCVRDYLTNATYGAGLSATTNVAILDGADDTTGLRLEALYAAENVYVPADTGVVAISAVATLTTSYAICKAAHGLATNDWVWIRNHNAAPTVDGRYQVTTVASTATFIIGATVTTAASTLGTFQKLTTQARFACHTTLDTSDTLRNNLEKLLTACRGMLTYQGGKYRVTIRRGPATDSAGRTLTAYPQVAVTSPVFSDANIVGDVEITVPGIDDKPNCLMVTFPNAAKRYEPETFPWPAVGVTNAYLTADATYTVQRDIELPATVNRYTAEQIAAVALEEGRHGIRLRFTAQEAALALAVGDIVSVTLSTPAWTSKAFRVMGLGLRPDGLVDLDCLEHQSTAYDETLFNDQDPASETGFQSPWYVYPPTALLATSGTWLPQIRLTWTAPADETVAGYDVQAKRASAPAEVEYRDILLPTALATSCVVPGVLNGETWNVRVRSKNRVGVGSVWVEATHTATIPGRATFTVAAVAQSTSITYTITFDTGCAWVEVYSREAAASGGSDPQECATDWAGNVRYASGGVSFKIATTGTYYRRTRCIGYDESGVKGYEPGVIETQATGTAAGLSAPSTLTAVEVNQTNITIGWTTGEAEAQTRVYKYGVVVQTLASAVATCTLTGLELDTTYTLTADHYKPTTGGTSAAATNLGVTTDALAAAPASFTNSAASTTVRGGINYTSYILTWVDCGAWELEESASATPGEGLIIATGAAGTGTYTVTHPDYTDQYYYHLRGTDPSSDWATVGPLDFGGI